MILSKCLTSYSFFFSTDMSLSQCVVTFSTKEGLKNNSFIRKLVAIYQNCFYFVTYLKSSKNVHRFWACAPRPLRTTFFEDINRTSTNMGVTCIRKKRIKCICFSNIFNEYHWLFFKILRKVKDLWVRF